MPTACLLCRQHKKRCEGSPCERCSTYGVDCVFPEVARQPRAKVAVVKRKLEKIESLVHTLNIDNLSSDEFKKTLFNKFPSKRAFTHTSFQPEWISSRSSSIPDLYHSSSPQLVPQVRQPLFVLFKDRLVETFVKYVHPTFPFIDLDKLYKMHSRERTHSICSTPLLNAIYCRGFRFLRLDEHSRSPPLDQDYFYQLTLQSIATTKSNNGLDLVQAEALLAFLEFSQDEVTTASRRSAKVVSLSHSLQLQDPEALCHQPFGASHDTDSLIRLIEKSATWVACVTADCMIGLLTKTPPLTRMRDLDFIDGFNVLSRLAETLSSKEDQLSDEDIVNFYSDNRYSGSSPTKSTPEMSHTTSSPPSNSSEIGSTSPAPLTIKERLIQLEKMSTVARYLSLMHSVIDYSAGSSPTQLQAEKSRLTQVIQQARSLLPSSITPSRLSSTTIGQDPNHVLDFVLYLSLHSVSLQIGIKLIKLANIPFGDPLESNPPEPSTRTCSGKKRAASKSSSSCCISSCASRTSSTVRDSKSQGSKCRSEIGNLISSGPSCLAGRQLVYQSAQAITQGFKHSVTDYWSPYAVSSLLFPSALVLVLMASKSDPASDAADAFRVANQLLSQYSTAWPLFGSPIDWGEPIECSLDSCPSKLPDSLSC